MSNFHTVFAGLPGFRPGWAFPGRPYDAAAITAYLLTLHLAQLVLPAAVMAVLMVTAAGWLPGWRGRRAWVPGWGARVALTFLLNLAVTVAGLVLFRADGKLATYGALALASALAQFVLWRGWRA